MKQNRKKQAYKKLAIPPIGIVNNIVISEKEVWAYYIVSERPFGFLSTQAQVTLGQSTMNAFAGLCNTATKKIDCHLLISNQPFNPLAWEEDMKKRVNKYNQEYNKLWNKEQFKKFIEDQANDLYSIDYRKRVTYLGVKLYSRGSFDFSSINPLEIGFEDAVEAFKKSVNIIFKLPNSEISETEEKRMKIAEEDIYRILRNSSLKVIRPSSEECLMVIKRRFYPSMPLPYLESNYSERVGLSDIIVESGGELEVKPRWLRFSQYINGEIYEGYRATLSLSKMPDGLSYPSAVLPFCYRPIMLPFTVNMRFSLIPTQAMKKELSNKQLDSEDEIKNLQNSNIRTPQSLQQTITSLRQLETELENSKLPWLNGHYRITVEAKTIDGLKTIITALKENYSSSDFTLSWTTGDQLDLFKEEFFGGQIEMKDFEQITSLDWIGLSGINYGGEAGDPVLERKQYTKKGK